MKRNGIIVQPSGNLGAAFNPAMAKHGGVYNLLVRAVPSGYEKIGNVNQFDNNYKSRLRLHTGDVPDQFNAMGVDAIVPDQPFDKYGVEDPRITKIGDTYYICYTSIAIGLGEPNADDGIRIALASTKDFKTFTKHGVIGPDFRSKAGTVFESGGKVHFLWKDENGTERTMLSPAPDDFTNAEAWQKLWADPSIQHHQLLGAQANAHEDHGVEPGAPPIEIEEGLLLIYSSISSEPKWTISAMLLDKNDPAKIISKTEIPLLRPEADYEVKGDVNNVVFPCGAIIDKDRLYVYYGAADTISAVASESMDVVRASLKPFQDKPKTASQPKP